MKKAVSILLLGLLAAVLAFAGLVRLFTGSRNEPQNQALPELAWLKQEFKLNDAEFAKIESLHSNYMPRCEGMCRSIDQKSSEIQQLLARTNALTPEIEQKLRESADLRFECEAMMLRHFVAVANSMPADQGKRYLQWAAENTILPHSKHSHPVSDPHQGR